MTFTILDEHVETASGKVSISIMHLGKGLEFRAVVVMACDDEIIPMQERIETDDDDLQEVYAGTDWPGTLDHAQQIAAHESPRNMSGFRARILGASRDDLDHPVDTFTDDADARRVVNVPVDAITPNPDQPRKYFDPQAVAESRNPFAGMASCNRSSSGAAANPASRSSPTSVDGALSRERGSQRSRS